MWIFLNYWFSWNINLNLLFKFLNFLKISILRWESKYLKKKIINIICVKDFFFIFFIFRENEKYFKVDIVCIYIELILISNFIF